MSLDSSCFFLSSVCLGILADARESAGSTKVEMNPGKVDFHLETDSGQRHVSPDRTDSVKWRGCFSS